MKTAYELAMERLAKAGPEPKVTEKQKKKLAELDSIYNAKVAERELFIKGELAKAIGQGDYAAQEQLERQLTSDRKSLLAEREEKKDKVRQSGS